MAPVTSNRRSLCPSESPLPSVGFDNDSHDPDNITRTPDANRGQLNGQYKEELAGFLIGIFARTCPRMTRYARLNVFMVS